MTVPLKSRIICFPSQQIIKYKKPSRTLPLSININEILIDLISSSLQIYPLLYFPFFFGQLCFVFKALSSTCKSNEKNISVILYFIFFMVSEPHEG